MQTANPETTPSKENLLQLREELLSRPYVTLEKLLGTIESPRVKQKFVSLLRKVVRDENSIDAVISGKRIEIEHKFNNDTGTWQMRKTDDFLIKVDTAFHTFLKAELSELEKEPGSKRKRGRQLKVLTVEEAEQGTLDFEELRNVTREVLLKRAHTGRKKQNAD